jgi:hypothetical protein
VTFPRAIRIPAAKPGREKRGDQVTAFFRFSTLPFTAMSRKKAWPQILD